MYIHLGQEQVVKTDEIIGIFDLDTTTVSKYSRDYLKRAEECCDVVNITEKLPKSFVVCLDKKTGRRVVYISQISTTTLLKRSDFIKEIKN